MNIVTVANPLSALVDNWWLFAIRGALAILFGILALVEPIAALAALVLVFGAWALVDGIATLVLALSGRRPSWQLVVVGLLGVTAGFVTFFWPGITAIGLYAAVAVWSIARGVVELALAYELRKLVTGEAWLVLGGISSILFGVLMIALPMAGMLALAWLIGVYALLFGGVMCALAVRLRRQKRAPEPRPMPPVATPPLPV